MNPIQYQEAFQETIEVMRSWLRAGHYYEVYGIASIYSAFWEFDTRIKSGVIPTNFPFPHPVEVDQFYNNFLVLRENAYKDDLIFLKNMPNPDEMEAHIQNFIDSKIAGIGLSDPKPVVDLLPKKRGRKKKVQQPIPPTEKERALSALMDALADDARRLHEYLKHILNNLIYVFRYIQQALSVPAA